MRDRIHRPPRHLPFIAGILALLSLPTVGEAQRADVSALGHLTGNADAPVQVVEFSDFGCSACALFAREVKPRIFDEYVRTGRIGWRMIAVRLAGFRHSAHALRAAECAARQDRFWAIEMPIQQGQKEWQGSREPVAELRELAEAAGADVAAWDACMVERGWDDPTRENNRAAQRSRVPGTPTFFVNGEPVIGAVPYADFASKIEAALAGAGR